MAGKGKKRITPKELEDIAGDVRKRSNTIKALTNQMRDKKITEANVMGRSMVEQSMKSIDAFILSIRREIGEA